MKPSQLTLALVGASLLFFACSSLQPGRGVPAAPPTETPISIQEPTSTPNIKIKEEEIFCSSDSAEARTLYTDAYTSQMNGNLTEAELLYRQALELDPEYCDAMDNLGQTLRQQGKIDEAILWYKKSLEVKPDNPVALQNLALAYNLQGETSKSIEMYEALVETAPENPEGYFGLGSIYYRLSQPEKAISYLTTAEKLYIQESSSYVSDAQYYLGFSYFEIQDCANTKKYFEAIYNLFSSDGNVNYALGVCYLQSEPKEIDTARNYILKAQEAGVQIPADVLKIIAEQ